MKYPDVGRASAAGPIPAESLTNIEIARLEWIRDLLLATERLQESLWACVGEVLADDQLSVAQWLIVSDIAINRKRTLTHFARSLSRDPGSLSRAIYCLVERGLLTSTRNENDRRSTDLRLTAAGHALYDRIRPCISRLASSRDLVPGTVHLDAITALMETALVEIAAKHTDEQPR